MASTTTKGQQPSQPQADRPLYRVTLFLSDGARPMYTCRAQSPEAARRKIEEREKDALQRRGQTVTGSMAELQP